MDNWRKSRSSIANGDCVEAGNNDREIAVRDSRDPARELRFPGAAWMTFLQGLKQD